MDPFTIMAIASAGLQFAGSAMSAKAQRKQGEASARAAQFNAKLVRIQGQQKEQLIRRNSKRHIGRMRVAIAKSGVTIQGSPLEALADSAAEAEIDALNARFDADVEASLNMQRSNATLDNAKNQSVATLLSGAVSAGSTLMEAR